jgi:signal transduction histidine kinase
LAELRELARGLHPAVLSEHGLAPALQSLAAHAPIPVELRVTNQRVQPLVEAAICFTVAEALTNVAKHASATSAVIEVKIQDGSIFATIADDGVGGADAAGGSGLSGLADRLDALAGAFSVASPSGHGTILRGASR